MKILWNKAWKIWNDAKVVSHIEPGNYAIRVSLFPLWKDQKCVEHTNGYNISKAGEFGFFHIVESLIEKCLMLCYNNTRNGFFSRRIVDRVRKVTNDLYIGWFGIRILWFWIRVSPFTMTRISK